MKSHSRDTNNRDSQPIKLYFNMLQLLRSNYQLESVCYKVVLNYTRKHAAVRTGGNKRNGLFPPSS